MSQFTNDPQLKLLNKLCHQVMYQTLYREFDSVSYLGSDYLGCYNFLKGKVLYFNMDRFCCMLCNAGMLQAYFFTMLCFFWKYLCSLSGILDGQYLILSIFSFKVSMIAKINS